MQFYRILVHYKPVGKHAGVVGYKMFKILHSRKQNIRTDYKRMGSVNVWDQVKCYYENLLSFFNL